MIFWWNICHVMKNMKLFFLNSQSTWSVRNRTKPYVLKEPNLAIEKIKRNLILPMSQIKKSALFLFYSFVSDSFLCCKYVWCDKIQHKVGWQRKFQSTWNELNYLGDVCSFSFSCCSKHFGSCYMRSYPIIKGDRQETLNSERTKVWEEV